MAKVDKYGRGSAAANGEGFVDLVPGDTFAALEAQLKRRIADRFDNAVLGISAMIGSKRNASELAKHLASGEEEEVHKFAAKNVGALFARGQLGISHDDKKAVVGQRWITRFIRVFAPFRFRGDGYLATLTLKDVDPDKRIYAVEAVEINQDAKSRSTPRGAISKDLNSAPIQDLTSQLTNMVSYYVGDVNRTHPNFIGRDEMFSTERTVKLLEGIVQDFCAKHQAPSTKHQAPKFSIIIPVYNVAPYLRECLDSVLAQAFTDWEAICVDDGSTDGSGAILDEYVARDARFKVFHQKNAGVSAARNAALDVAQGEWVCFVDADDMMVSSYLELFESCAYKADVNYFNIQATNELGEVYKTTLPEVRCMPITKAIIDFGFSMVFRQRIDTFGITWSKIIRGELAKFVRFDVALSAYEDLLYTLKVCENAKTFSCFQTVLYKYRITSKSLSHCRLSKEKRRERMGQLAMAFKKCGDDLSSVMLKKIAYSRCLGFYCGSKIGWKSWREAIDLAKMMADCCAYTKPDSAGKFGRLLEKTGSSRLLLACLLWIYANVFNRYIVRFLPGNE